eukprot:TRINITY_DN78956_c0_g1_i1.p1 TRINITY_DN78956_c0_g1~~TRINITY_DN78956_c0_g1_i1.p1  ORF type:complete len:245 (-),score=58.98 TRINITY_DN78956_c0_g1_i1:8-706(-)
MAARPTYVPPHLRQGVKPLQDCFAPFPGQAAEIKQPFCPHPSGDHLQFQLLTEAWAEVDCMRQKLSAAEHEMAELEEENAQLQAELSASGPHAPTDHLQYQQLTEAWAEADRVRQKLVAHEHELAQAQAEKAQLEEELECLRQHSKHCTRSNETSAERRQQGVHEQSGHKLRRFLLVQKAFQAPGAGYLSAEEGTELVALYKEGLWYFGYALNNPSLTGWFPSSDVEQLAPI